MPKEFSQVHHGIIDSDRVNQLSDWEFRVYTLLIYTADYAGRTDARQEKLRSALFPLGSNRRAADVMHAVSRCEELDLLVQYEFDGKPFIQLRRVRISTPAKLAEHPWLDGCFEITAEDVQTRDGPRKYVTSSLVPKSMIGGNQRTLPDPFPNPSASLPDPIGHMNRDIERDRKRKRKINTNPLTPLPSKGDDVLPASPPANPASPAPPAGRHSPPAATTRPQDESPPVPKRRTRQRSSGEDSVVAIPDKLNTSRFRKAWSDWLADRRDRRKPLTVRAQEIQLGKLAQWGEQAAIASIERSIASGWQGLFEPPDVPRDSEGESEPFPTREMPPDEIEACAALIKSWNLKGGGEAA